MEPDQVELVEEGSPVDAVVVVLPGKNSAEAEEQIQPGSEGDVTDMPGKTGNAPVVVVRFKKIFMCSFSHTRRWLRVVFCDVTGCMETGG